MPRGLHLDQGRQTPASGARESLEADALPVLPVALAPPPALERVVRSRGGDLHVRKGLRQGGVREGPQVGESGDPGRAADLAPLREDFQLVLLALDGLPGEGHVEDDSAVVVVRVDRDGYVVDHPVGELEQRALDVLGEDRVGRVPGDGLGRERFVQLRREPDREGLAVEVGVVEVGIEEGYGLDLRVLVAVPRHAEEGVLIEAGDDVHDVVSVGAHSLLTGQAVPPRIADAHPRTVAVEGVVVERPPPDPKAREGVRGTVVVLVVHDPERQILDILARAVAGTLARAGLAAAPLALVAGVANALARLPVALALVRALGVGVPVPLPGWAVDPGELERAESVAAVASRVAVRAPSLFVERATRRKFRRRIFRSRFGGSGDSPG